MSESVGREFDYEPEGWRDFFIDHGAWQPAPDGSRAVGDCLIPVKGPGVTPVKVHSGHTYVYVNSRVGDAIATESAHRVMMEAMLGRPAGRVKRRCDVTTCVSPAHLYEVGTTKGRAEREPEVARQNGKSAGASFGYSPEGWVEWFRENAERAPAPESSAAGGRCWLASPGDGVTIDPSGYARVSVVWADGSRQQAGAHRVTVAAVATHSLPPRHELDGGTITGHHLCRVRNCVRPDHIELVDGILNSAEARARTSVAAATETMIEELEVAHAHELKRARALLRELGRVRDERDTAVGLLEKLGNRVLELDAELGRARDESARLYERLEKRR